MPTTNAQATGNQSADSTQPGTTAVTGNTNTGHASTTCFGTNGGGQQKSCRWHTFSPTSIPGTKVSVKLKFDWSQNGNPSTGDVNFQVQYTVNGGSNWNTVFSHSGFIGSSSGSESVTLSVGQDISQIQVRDLLEVFSSPEDSSSMNATISSIQVEVVTGSGLSVLAGGM